MKAIRIAGVLFALACSGEDDPKTGSAGASGTGLAGSGALAGAGGQNQAGNPAFAGGASGLGGVGGAASSDLSSLDPAKRLVDLSASENTVLCEAMTSWRINNRANLCHMMGVLTARVGGGDRAKVCRDREQSCATVESPIVECPVMIGETCEATIAEVKQCWDDYAVFWSDLGSCEEAAINGPAREFPQVCYRLREYCSEEF